MLLSLLSVHNFLLIVEMNGGVMQGPGGEHNPVLGGCGDRAPGYE